MFEQLLNACEPPDRSNLTWDAYAHSRALASVRHKQGLHLGRMAELGFEPRADAGLTALTEEVVKSSAIEGEHLDPSEVRSSIARKLGLEAGGLPEPGRAVEGVVEMMLDAIRCFDLPLTRERLFGWHAALFPTGRSAMTRMTVGAWRTADVGPMRVVSGPPGRERVHFEAPDAERLGAEMKVFLEWFNGSRELDAVLKAGISHFRYVAIHPFEDGNGRIARAIADMALARADGTKERFYSMSSGIEAERSDYYLQLESPQRGGLDITAWLAWFLGCLARSLDGAEQMLSSVLRKARTWQRIGPIAVNDRQRLVINRMLGDFEGHLSTMKYAELAKCSNDTALSDIRALVERGVLAKNPGGGRSTSYRLAEPEDLPA